MNKLLILSLVIMLTACTQEKTVSIKTNVTDPEIRELVILNEVLMSYDTITNFNAEPLILDIDNKPSIVKVQAGRMSEYIYLQAGSEITISKELGARAFNITNSNASEQKLLSEFGKQMDIASSKYNMNEMANNSEQDFVKALDKKYEVVRELLENGKKEGVSTELITWLEGRIVANAAESKAYYPDYYKYMKKEDPVLSADFYKSESEFDLNNEQLFYFDDVKSAAMSVLGREINFENYEDMSGYYADQYDEIDESITKSSIAEVLKFMILNDKINFAGGIQGFETQIDKFLQTVKDPSRKKLIAAAVAKWAHLKKGLEAPDFTAYTRDGEEVKLSDLKGKNVYIDVWATWCGPCIAEIPSLKAMEQKYHGENLEFVSVSIDKESDREKWMKFVVDKDLKGIQIMTNTAGSAQIGSKYNISGIPRFIMIDENGGIVSADAPRPSNEGLFTKMIDKVLN